MNIVFQRHAKETDRVRLHFPKKQQGRVRLKYLKKI